MLSTTCILLICLSSFLSPIVVRATLSLNLTLPHQHPDPEAVVLEVQR